MPKLNVNGAEVHYQEHGAGEQTIVFAHGLLFDGRLFAPQVEALQDRYRCITFDFRGQGQSEVTPDGYDMDTLAEDAAALIEALDCGPCHFAGLSMGGFIALRLAIHRPELLRSIMLLDTSADPEPADNVPRYRRLNFVARWFGLRLVAGKVMPILFSQSFLNDPQRRDEQAEYRRRVIGNHRLGISRAVRGVIERQGVADELHQITVPTLILVGEEDVATVPAKSERLHSLIAGSQLVTIPAAGHSSTLEQPARVNAELEKFLQDMAAQSPAC